MKLKNIILSLILVLVIYLFYHYVYDGTRLVKSKLDNRFYSVRNSYGKETKADLLALINLKLDTIVKQLQESSNRENPAVARLVANWNRGVTIKEIGKLESDAAYVINKQFMSFCLPDDISSSLSKINLMTYVGIHELAHIMSVETGHGDEFIKNFEFLLNYAKQINYLDPLSNKYLPVYIPLNKLNTDDNYCGVALINSIN
jgi:hypothetical protein